MLIKSPEKHAWMWLSQHAQSDDREMRLRQEHPAVLMIVAFGKASSRRPSSQLVAEVGMICLS